MEGRVVVRHGFLEFVEDAPPRRARALSDSAMDGDLDKEFPTHPLAHVASPLSGKTVISEASTETAVSETAESAPLTSLSAAEDGASSLDAMPHPDHGEDWDEAFLPMPTPEIGPISAEQAPMMDSYYFLPAYYDGSEFMPLYPPSLYDGMQDAELPFEGMLAGAEFPFEDPMRYFHAPVASQCADGLCAASAEPVQCCDGAGMMTQEQREFFHAASTAQCPEALCAAPACDGAAVASRESASAETRTTAMLRNLPAEYNRAMLLELLDAGGFAALYDFVYLPMDFRSNLCFGYGFVNFVTPAAAEFFQQHFDGFCQWTVNSSKVAEVSWSDPLQGLEAHVERYRDSPLMHDNVPDMYKPVLLSDGARILFPPPTRKLKAPRIRHAKGADTPPARAEA